VVGDASYHPEWHLWVTTPETSGRMMPAMEERHERAEPSRYEIHVAAGLDRTWSNWFDGLRVERVSDTRTRLTGPVQDQAALHGVLNQIRDLGLEIVSVTRVDDNEETS
jgi:hypothetical protein